MHQDCRVSVVSAALAFLLLFLAIPSLAIAEDEFRESKKLKTIERQLERDREEAEALDRKANSLSNEISELKAQLINQARAVQDQEERLSTQERELKVLSDDLRDKTAALEQKREQLGYMVAALERIARQPPQALLFSRTAPVDTVRSAMLLKVAVPEIEARAANLREELDTIATTRALYDEKQIEGAQTNDQLSRDRQRLNALLRQKGKLLRMTESQRDRASRRVQRLTAEATNLRELIETLEADRRQREQTRSTVVTGAARTALSGKPGRDSAAREAPGATVQDGDKAAEPKVAVSVRPVTRPDDVRKFPKKRRSLTLPVRGSVVRKFGEKSEFGDNTKGVELKTRTGAQIVAPYDGQIVFAGPFRGYGRIVIIEHTGGYHSLLSGVETIDVDVGTWLLAGEPVGAMTVDAVGGPVLYYELRRRGKPINPLPWLASRDEKVNG